MSDFDRALSPCDHEVDAAAYALHALDEHEVASFEAHLATCHTCAREVTELRLAVDTLPMSVEPYAPPAALKDRIMRVVNAEAELLAAAGATADVVAPGRSPRRARWAALLSQRPAFAAAAAAVLVAVGIAGGVLASRKDSPQTRTVAARVAHATGRADVALKGDRASLRLARFSPPPAGQVYQVWLMRKGGKPVPTHTLFNVRADGKATVEVQETVKGYDEMLVTVEPSGGSQQPSSSPVIAANI